MLLMMVGSLVLKRGLDGDGVTLLAEVCPF